MPRRIISRSPVVPPTGTRKKILFILLVLLVLSSSLFLFSLSTRHNSAQRQTHNSPVPSLAPTKKPVALSYTTQSGKPPQFVLLSFDGSKSLQMWQDTRSFAQRMKEKSTPVHFTYFISGVYFLTDQTAQIYHPPGKPVGTTAIGFSDSNQDIVDRVKQMNGAIAEGHEIASHANGHFDGSAWSQPDWTQEFNEWHKLVFNWRQNNQLETVPNSEDLQFQQSEVVGFRSPLLAKNPSMYQALKAGGYTYDASGVATIGEWPTKNADGIWLIPLGSIPLAGTRQSIISMDYNFFATQSRGRDIIRRTNPAWKKDYNQMANSYLNYFQTNYNGNRSPVVIGHHFSTWNDGVYWQVMQDFAQNVCGKPEVYCVSFSELVNYLETKK